ncbi:MAG TPA: acetylglutamate kinase, partial [Herpetosiphonaceae bacterium]
AVGASEAVFVSNVPGVLVGGEVAPLLGEAEVRALIDDGTISGGMIPKVTAALLALAQGVRQVRITNLDALAGGTRIAGAAR